LACCFIFSLPTSSHRVNPAFFEILIIIPFALYFPLAAILINALESILAGGARQTVIAGKVVFQVEQVG
jgi:hypothetical protein